MILEIATELLSLACILQGGFQAGLCDTYASAGYAVSANIQCGSRYGSQSEAAPPYQVLLWYDTFVQVQLGQHRSARTQHAVNGFG